MKRPSLRQAAADALGFTFIEARRIHSQTDPKLMREISRFTNPSEAQEAYLHAPPRKEEQEYALEKWISLCKDTLDLNSVWSIAKNDISGKAREMFIERWISVSKNPEDLRILALIIRPCWNRELLPVFAKATRLIRNARRVRAAAKKK